MIRKARPMMGESDRDDSITKLEPGSVELMQLKSAADSIKLLRMKLARGLEKRDRLVCLAVAAGASQETTAAAARTTQARVSQIVARGADS